MRDNFFMRIFFFSQMKYKISNSIFKGHKKKKNKQAKSNSGNVNYIVYIINYSDLIKNYLDWSISVESHVSKEI